MPRSTIDYETICRIARESRPDVFPADTVMPITQRVAVALIDATLQWAEGNLQPLAIEYPEVQTVEIDRRKIGPVCVCCKEADGHRIDCALMLGMKAGAQ